MTAFALQLLLLPFCVCWGPSLSAHAQYEPQVTVKKLPDGFERALTDEAMDPLYRASLQQDLLPHKARGKPYQLRDIATTIDKLLPLKYYKHNTLIVVKDGALYTAPFVNGTVPPPTPRRISALLNIMGHAAVHSNVKLPDSVFIMNTWDEPRCPAKKLEKCDAPVLSVVKQWDRGTNTSVHLDILVPFFNHAYEDTLDYPWEKKNQKALMRGAMQNGLAPNCTRMWLHRLGSTPEGKKLMDAGITNNLKDNFKVNLVPQVSLANHSKWKFLLVPDGFTASCRFGKLLGSNSVIVKEVSRWIEFYYRLLQPQTHYIPFTKAGAWKTIQSLSSWEDAELQAMGKRGQAFQQKFLTNASKALYMRRAIQEYTSLFEPDAMSAFVRRLDLTRVKDLSYVKNALREAA